MRTHNTYNRIRMTVQRWLETSRGRRELRNLSEHILKDIGISSADAEREARRPFWDQGAQVDSTLHPHHLPATGPCRSGQHCPSV